MLVKFPIAKLTGPFYRKIYFKAKLTENSVCLSCLFSCLCHICCIIFVIALYSDVVKIPGGLFEAHLFAPLICCDY